jgi:hypothetical protein
MESNWAAENLQVIRTLMERAALYRRALAPVTMCVGALGTVAATVGVVLRLNSMRAFGFLWLGTALVAVNGAFLIARRQALKDKEPFWSPPTRRVTQALLPPLASGFFLVLMVTVLAAEEMLGLFVLLAALFYGCAVHAAGFFMPRGIRLYGWLLISCTMALFLGLAVLRPDFTPPLAHLLMGFLFGILHLAYGAYLYLSEKGKTAQ